MEKINNKCDGCIKPIYRLGLCEECYEDLYESVKEDEPDFVLENDVATITEVGAIEPTEKIYFYDTADSSFQPPRWYSVDLDKVVTNEDAVALFKALFSEAKFSELSPEFESIKHLLKMPD